MISIKRTLAGIFLVLLVASVAACGGRDHHRNANLSDAEIEERAMDGVEKAMDRLDGTDAQTKAIQAEVQALLPAFHELRDLKEPTRDALVAEFASGSPDGERVAGTIDGVIDQGTAFAHDASDGMLRIHGILTPEQRDKIATFIESKGDRSADRRRRGERMKQAMIGGFLDEIEATDEQAEFVLAKVDEFKARGEKLRAQREPVRQFFLQQLRAPKPDAVAIHAQVGDISTQLRDFVQDVAGASVEFTHTLTPKQQQIIKELIASRRR